MEKDLQKGQHFLINKDILQTIINTANIDKNDKIIEIGVGEGFLTKELVKYCEVLGFEIDKRYNFKDKNLILVNDNCLNYSWEGYNKIVSNIPYLITEPLIKKAIYEEIKELIILVGENFKKIIEINNTKLGIITNLFYNVEFIEEVKKENFNPIPRVNSWIIKLKLKTNLTNSEMLLQEFIFRKEKIKNALTYSFVQFGKTKKEGKEIVNKMNLDENILEKRVYEIDNDSLNLLREKLKEILD